MLRESSLCSETSQYESSKEHECFASRNPFQYSLNSEIKWLRKVAIERFKGNRSLRLYESPEAPRNEERNYPETLTSDVYRVIASDYRQRIGERSCSPLDCCAEELRGVFTARTTINCSAGWSENKEDTVGERGLIGEDLNRVIHKLVSRRVPRERTARAR